MTIPPSIYYDEKERKIVLPQGLTDGKGMTDMTEMEAYTLWTSQNLEDRDLTEELAAIKGDVEAIKDRFYCDLEFGTGGLRGVIGAGTNRMNIYTVRRATQGLADYLNERYPSPRAAISYDSRIKSDVFAKEAARVLAANGVKVHIYKQLMPTPCLSFAVRELKCQAGVMVTASHNPAKYNGYKCYGEDGCQMTNLAADAVTAKIEKVDLFRDVRLVDFEDAVKDGMIEYIGDEVFEKFIQNVKAQAIHPGVCSGAGLKVVYTPLNGTGNIPVRTILKEIGVEDIIIVKEQELPDGNFTTCPFPNPEIKEALALGLEVCRKEKADLLLATDPDCDRVGIAVPDKNGDYVLITGNEDGALLFQYICEGRTEAGTMPERPVAVKTIVTSEIITKIAARYGVELRNVLTGFKYIGEQIGYLEKDGEENRYIFGFEESYGYLAGTYVRDKDAVVASMLICEMAAYYKTQGISVLDALKSIYDTYGVYVHSQGNFVCEGEQGMEQMLETMDRLRKNPPKAIGGLPVEVFADYETQEKTDLKKGTKEAINLPKSNVLGFDLADGASVVIRPSGTEPKMKAYYTATAATFEEAKALEQKIAEDFKARLGF